ncbi:MAG: ABC transporter permease subunit [Erysipelotrichaceae bacterium]
MELFKLFARKLWKSSLLAGGLLAILLFLLIVAYPAVLSTYWTQFVNLWEPLPPLALFILGWIKSPPLDDFSFYLGFLFQYVLLFVALWALLRGARLLPSLQKERSILHYMSMPITRTQLYVHAMLATLVFNLIIIALLSLGLFAALYVNDPSLAFIQSHSTLPLHFFAMLVVIQLFFSALGFFFGALSNKPAEASLLGMILFLILSLIGVFSRLIPPLSILRILSPLDAVDPRLFAQSEATLLPYGIFAGLAVLLLVGGWALYRKKDLVV